MNELEEIMNGKHEIKHLRIDNDTLTFNTELNNYDWNLTARDIEMIIYTFQKDKNQLQNLIDKTTNYYLKTLAKNKSMPDEAVEMFNLLEGNK